MLKSFTSLLSFCLFVLSIFESEVPNYWSCHNYYWIVSLRFINFCFMYTEAVVLGTNLFITLLSSWCIYQIYHYRNTLFISGNSFLLKSGVFFDINIAISLVIGSVLFNFHIFVTFPNLLLLFISNFIPWLSENILSVISSLLNLSGLVSQPSCGLSCRISHVHLRRPFILLGGVFYRFLLGLVG